MSTNKFKILTLLFHGFIVIAAGHGIGIMAMLDTVILLQTLTIPFTDSSFTFFEDFGNQIAIAIILSLIGKLLLIISFFIKSLPKKKIVELLGIVFLFFNLILFITDNRRDLITSKLVFCSGLPFVISLSFFIYYKINNYKPNQII